MFCATYEFILYWISPKPRYHDYVLFHFLQILSDAALSDVYDSLINVISADLPSSVYLYKFKYDGKLCTMKSKLANLLEKPLQGNII